MATTLHPESAQILSLPQEWTLADLQEHLGGIPLDRIRLFPPLGTATEADREVIEERDDRLLELVDGILVEKPMGAFESFLAGVILQILNNFLQEHDLGVALAPDGPVRTLPTRTREPDVSVILWERLPGKKFPRDARLKFAPNLAVEVLSKGNTKKEMRIKTQEYFDSGVQLVWLIDPKTQTAKAYRSPDEVEDVNEDGSLDGGAVLPGFQLSLRDLFSRVERE